jgi:hypothetical protein
MIAASLLYHAKDYIAFWLLVALLNKLKMRDIFEPKMPGFSMHIQIIDFLIFSK